MELQLSDLIDFTIDGASDIELPSYVIRLMPQSISTDVAPAKLIIAIGVDPKDNQATLVTGDGRILLFDLNRYYIPNGPAIPYDSGKQIFFENLDGRWPGDSKGFFADSEWVIEKSTSALTGAVLRVNYPHENNNPRTKKTD
jgi:hypothetical protein